VSGDTTNGSTTIEILGADSQPLAGYNCSMVSGANSCSIDLSGLDPEGTANHATLYLRATLEDVGGSPTLNSWSVSWTIQTAPSVTTDAASSVISSAATVNGTITDTGNETGAGTQHGFAWGTNSSLSVGDTATTTLGTYSATGGFNQIFSSLSSNTTYYFRAYATNSLGTTFGDILSFITRIFVGGGNSIGNASPVGAGIISGGESGGGGESIGSEIDYHTLTFNVPAGDTITGIAVKLEASASQAGGTFGVELSWDGGSTVTTNGKATPALTTSDAVYTLGGSSDTWGRSWSASEFSNANFRARVTGNPSNNTVRLDALQVRVYHQATGGGAGGGGEI
jgi:hypothetical protein